MNEVLSLAPAGLGATLIVMLAGWLISVPTRNVAIVDVCWSIAIAAAGLTWLVSGPDGSSRGLLAATLLVAWALRLAGHILWRGWGQPEDRRYREIRARNEPNFTVKSLYLVFALQALLAWLVAMPLLGIAVSSSPPGWLDAVGALIVVTGLVFEAVADFQLARFQADPVNAGGVMNRGLWRYSRHPNYFGEFCLWWGLWLIAVSGGAWWTVFSPLLLSFFLLKFSGVALTEKDIATRRPAYRDYIRQTSAFVPMLPRA